MFSLDSAARPTATAPASGAPGLTAVDALLALQSAPEAMCGRTKAAKRGRALLDLLDDLRDGLLSGHVSLATVRRLQAALAERTDHFTDPGLQAVMDDIELRAQVELAKLSAF